MDFKPFENDSQVASIGALGNGLTFENSTDCVLVYGDLSFAKDQMESLDDLDDLIELLVSIRACIKSHLDE